MTENQIEQVENGLTDKQTGVPDNQRMYALAERMAEYRVPGVSAAVFSGGKIEWAKGYGLRARGETGQIDSETIFQAASISKPLAALAILRLFEARGLDVDADVNQYLTSWKVPAVDGWQPRLTLRQLLSHSAGTTVTGFFGYNFREPVPTLLQILDGLPPANSDPIRVNTLPGIQFRYSGGGTSIAQQMAMDLTGQPFPEFVREWALEPLGMTRSLFQHPLSPQHHDNAARGHYYTGALVEGNWHTYPELAAAGMWTTPSDVARFALALQAAYQGKPGVISKQVADWMLTEVIAAETYSLGMGLFLFQRDHSARFAHGGDNVGYKNDFYAYYTGGDQGAVVMTNGDQGGTLLEEIFGSIARVYDWPDYFPQAAQREIDVTTPYSAYTGSYRVGELALVIALTGSQLLLLRGGQNPLELRPLANGKFQVQGLNAAVAFEHLGDGHISGLVFEQNGRSLKATRLG
ncbi:MAG: serine hydrolase [Chloroflexi bacterium]|nr:serine hydrolase [Chloroflexota bacterium]